MLRLFSDEFELFKGNCLYFVIAQLVFLMMLLFFVFLYSVIG